MKKIILFIALCMLLSGCQSSSNSEYQKKIAMAQELNRIREEYFEYGVKNGISFEEYARRMGLHVTKQQLDEAHDFLIRVEQEDNKKQGEEANKYFK